MLFALAPSLIVLLSACSCSPKGGAGSSADTDGDDTSGVSSTDGQPTGVAMRDGVELWTQVTCPAGAGPSPTLLMRTPYLSESLLPTYQAVVDLRVSQGSCAVLQAVRGTWESGGQARPFAQELPDGYDMVQWVVEQPWSDGPVATMGSSYDGFAALAAASHPSVVAVIADGPITDPLVGSPSLRGGVLSLDPLWWLYLVDQGDWPSTEEVSQATNQRPIEDLDELLLGERRDYWTDFVAYQDDPLAAFWLDQRLDEVWATTCANVLLVKANSERFEGPILAFDALGQRSECGAGAGQTFLAVGSTTHGAFLSYWGSAWEEDQVQPIYDLADRILAASLGSAAGTSAAETSADPPVLLRPQNSDSWTTGTEWPPTGTQDQSYWLEPAGDAGTLLSQAGKASDSFLSDPQGSDPCSTDDYPASLWFSAELGQATTLAGSPTLDLQLSATSWPTEVHAILWSWSPKLDWQLISDGGLRVASDPALNPDGSVSAQIQLQPMAIALPSDAWLGLSLVGSRCAVVEFPNVDDWASTVSGLATDIAVYGAASVLHLPVVPQAR